MLPQAIKLLNAIDHNWLTDEAVAGYAAPAHVRGTTAAQDGQARAPKDGAPPTVPGALGTISQRTLLIWGAADPVFPIADARRLVQLLPRATLREFAGVGHLPHEERVGEVTAAILTFLSSTTDD